MLRIYQNRSNNCMTYKKIHKIKSSFLILFIILIILQNFKLIYNTRNPPYIQFQARKERVFLLNSSISKNKAKLTIFNLKQHWQNSFFLDLLSQVSDYFINIQSRSVSSSKILLSNIF